MTDSITSVTDCVAPAPQASLPRRTSLPLWRLALGLLILLPYVAMVLMRGKSVGPALMGLSIAIVIMGAYIVVYRSHPLRPTVFQRDGVGLQWPARQVSYASMASVILHKKRYARVTQRDGTRVNLSLAGLPRGERLLLVDWLRKRIGAAVFA